MTRRRLNSPNKITTPASGTTHSIDYSEKERTLEVEYVGYRIYHYYHVPLEIWEQYKNVVLTGGSSGEFVNSEIKPNYPYDQV